MVARRKRSMGKPGHLNSGLSHHALLIRVLDLLISLFEKEKQQELAYSKRWEKEKINNFGLASSPLHPRRSPAKDINFTSWDREKIFNFGLTTSQKMRNIHRNEHFSKERLSDEKLTPKIAPVKWKKEQPQSVVEKEKTVDDFFKILGYE